MLSIGNSGTVHDKAEDQCLAAAIAIADNYALRDGQDLYIMHQVGQEVVKIGVTTNFRKRRSQVQIGSPHPVVVLAVIPGGVPMERALHRLFVGYRVSGEWFLLAGAVARFIVYLYSRSLYLARPTHRPAPRSFDMRDWLGLMVLMPSYVLQLNQEAFLKFAENAVDDLESPEVEPS